MPRRVAFVAWAGKARRSDSLNFCEQARLSTLVDLPVRDFTSDLISRKDERILKSMLSLRVKAGALTPAQISEALDLSNPVFERRHWVSVTVFS